MSDLIEQLGAFRSPTSVLDGDGASPAPTEAELARPVVAPGSDALLSCAIEYQAGWDILEDGMARHGRSQVRALSRAGLPVVLRRLSRPKFMMEEDVDPRVRASVGYLRDTSAASVAVAIRQLVVHNATFLENTIAPAGARWSGFADEQKVYASTIVYTPWERTTVGADVVSVLNRCAEVWVHGEWVVEIFKRAGVHKVYAIPVAYDPDTDLACHISAPRGSETVPEGKRFYAIGKWEPRKNYHGLLGAFLLEFSPKERASLFIKTYEWGEWTGYPSVSESTATWLAEPAVQAKGWTRDNYEQRVRVLSKKIPDEKIAQLHRDNNIYVEPSHGEAWCAVSGTTVNTPDGPVAIEAMAAGNLVFTHTGRPRRVIRTNTRHYDGPVCEIWVHGLRSALTFTPEHKHYVVRRDGEKHLRDVQLYREFVEARELRTGDLWVVPKLRALPKVEHLRISRLIPVRASSGKIVCPHSYDNKPAMSLTKVAAKTGYSFQFVSKVLNGTAHQRRPAREILAYVRSVGLQQPKSVILRDKLSLTPDMMFFLGHYIAKGSGGPSRVSVSGHRLERAGRKISARAVKRAFGLTATEYQRGANSIELRFANTVVVRLLRTLCGYGAEDKYIHSVLKRSPNIKHLLRGLFYGDGSAAAGKYRFSTISPRLASDLVEVCNRLGVFLAKAVHTRPRGRPCYTLTVAQQHAGRFHRLVRPLKYESACAKPAFAGHRMLREDQANFYVPIRVVKTSPYRGMVHNIAVDTDESYTTNGFATHNCMPAFSARCAGNRMVYTGWGGPADFAGADDVPIWKPGTSHMAFVHPGYGWESDACWAACPMPWIQKALRSAQPPKRRIHPPDFYPRFGLAPVGAMMAKRIAERFPEAYVKLVAAGGFG